MLPHQWYYTAVATRQWLAATGRDDDDGGPNWIAAEQELCEMSHQAKAVDTTQSGAVVWRVKAPVRGRMRRVEMTVIESRRDEGDLPQLVRVRVR